MTKEEIQALIASEIKENLKFEVKIETCYDRDGIWAQIGFIPKTYSKTISELMDSGVKLFVELECLNGFQVGDGEMEPKGLDIRVMR